MAIFRYISKCTKCGHDSSISKLIEGENFSAANKDVPAFVTYYCSNCRTEYTDIFDLEKYNFITDKKICKPSKTTSVDRVYLGLINRMKRMNK